MEKQQYKAYAAATQTVAKTRQIVMLYDGAIRYVQQAKEAIKDNRIEDRFNILTKASEIIMGLQGCLDFERGGDIAKILYGYYSTIVDRIFTIHRTNDPEACDEIIARLKEMRDVWHEIDQSQNSGGTTQADSPPPAAASEPAEADNESGNAPQNSKNDKGPLSGVTLSA